MRTDIINSCDTCSIFASWGKDSIYKLSTEIWRSVAFCFFKSEAVRHVKSLFEMTQRQNQSDTLNNNQEYEDINFISAILNNEEEEEEEKISSEYLGEKGKTSLYYIVLSFSIIVLVVVSIYIYFSFSISLFS